MFICRYRFGWELFNFSQLREISQFLWFLKFSVIFQKCFHGAIFSSFCKLYETCVTKREKATLINCTNGFNRDKFGGGRGIMNNE